MILQIELVSCRIARALFVCSLILVMTCVCIIIPHASRSHAFQRAAPPRPCVVLCLFCFLCVCLLCFSVLCLSLLLLSSLSLFLLFLSLSFCCLLFSCCVSYAGPLTQSARSVADSHGAGHGQVQRDRDAIACLYEHAQTELINKVLEPEEKHKYLIYKLRFDETHFDVQADTGDGFNTTDGGSFPTVICKASLVWLPFDDLAEEHEQPITVAPAVLPCPADSESLWKALKSKLPFWIDDPRLEACANHVMFTIGHDAHRANPRLIRAMETLLGDQTTIPWTLVSSRCTMHQVQIVFRMAYERLSFHNPVYCLGHLLRIGKNSRAVKRHIHAIIKERFRVRYVDAEAWGAPHPTMHRLLEECFMKPSPVAPSIEEDNDDGDEHDSPETSSASRREVVTEFECMFSSDPFDSDIVHTCSLFVCRCRDEQDSLKRALAVADKVILPTLLPIIALNKWTGYQQPSKCVGLACMYNLLPLAWARLQSDLDESDGDEHEEAEGVDREAYQAMKKTRHTKVASFFGVDKNSHAPTPFALTDPEHPLKSILLALAIAQPLNDLAVQFFKDAKDEHLNLRRKNDRSFRTTTTNLASRRFSPVVPVLHKFKDMLSMGDSDVWALIRALGAWNVRTRICIRDLALLSAANAWHRLFEHYHHAPWTVNDMVDERFSQPERQRAKDAFVSAMPCCIGRRLASLQQSAAAADDDDEADAEVIDGVSQAPNAEGIEGVSQASNAVMFHTASQTIPVELGFRRVRLHSSTSGGQMQHVSTVSSNHILSDTRSSLLSAQELQRIDPEHRVRNPSKASCKKTSPYKQFLGNRMSTNRGHSTQSNAFVQAPLEWAGLDAAAKQPFARKARRINLQRGAASNAAPAERDPVVTPWGLGDDRFPFALRRLEQRMREDRNGQVNTFSRYSDLWRERHGQLTIPTFDDGFPEDIGKDSLLCSEEYGIGFCLANFTAAERDHMKSNKDVLNSIVRNIGSLDKHMGTVFVFEGRKADAIPVHLVLILVYYSGNPEFHIYAKHLLTDVGVGEIQAGHN